LTSFPQENQRKNFAYASPDIKKKNNEVSKAYVKGSSIRKKGSDLALSSLQEIQKLSNGNVGPTFTLKATDLEELNPHSHTPL
jgi:hypothetical protein